MPQKIFLKYCERQHLNKFMPTSKHDNFVIKFKQVQGIPA